MLVRSFYLILCVTTAPCSAQIPRAGTHLGRFGTRDRDAETRPVTLKKVICTSDPQLVRDMLCKLTPKSRTEKNILLTVYILKQQKLQIRFKNSIKKPNNQYMPGLYDVTLNICALGLDSTGISFPKFFLDHAVPDWKIKYGDLIHACPYQGWLTYNNTITGPKVVDPTYQNDPSKAYYSKTDLMFYLGEDKRTAFNISLFDTNYR